MRGSAEVSALHVLHVLPIDIARGAQVYARALADHANRRPGERHEVVVLFRGPRVAALAEHELDVVPGRLYAAAVDPRAAWRLSRLVRRTAPDVVVAHGAEAMKYVLLVRRPSRPVVYHSIGVVAPKARSGASRVLNTTLVRRADLVTAVSGAVADELHEVFGVDRAAVTVVPNGRDPAQFTGGEPRAADQPPQLIFVGQVTRTKRPELFVEVATRLRARGLDFDAVLVGDGPMEAEIAAAATAAGVRLLGRRDDVPALLQAASVFVFPSMAEGEGMPGVIIEAGMARLPLVGTDVPGMRDVVVDAETGRVVAADDVDGLTAGVAELLVDPPLRAAWGAAARERCTRLYSLEASTTSFLAALHKLVGG